MSDRSNKQPYPEVPVWPSVGNAIGTFEFRGHEHAAVRAEDRAQWVSVTQLCRFIGISAEGQRQALTRKAWADSRTCVLQVQLPGDTQSRAHFLIHERIVPMWISNISAQHIRDEVVRRNVDTYQREFADALYNYVHAGLAVRDHDELPEWVQHQLATLIQVGRLEVEQQRHALRLNTVEARLDGIEGSHGWFSALAYARREGLPTSVQATQALGRMASRICRSRGIAPGKTQHQLYGEVNTYPENVLAEAAGATPSPAS